MEADVDVEGVDEIGIIEADKFCGDIVIFGKLYGRGKGLCGLLFFGFLFHGI